MPATYMTYIIEPEDSLDEIRAKLYTGVISAGEQAYTLGAAIAECRKTLAELERTRDTLDKAVNQLRQDYHTNFKLKDNKRKLRDK